MLSFVSVAFMVVCLSLFVYWHERFPVLHGSSGAPLTIDEIDAFLKRAQNNQHEVYQQVTQKEKKALREFLLQDDNRPFFMVNLMHFKEGPEARSAHHSYTEVVVPNLFARGSYPIFASEKISDFLVESDSGDGDGDGTFWDQTAIVRYRSRRDFIDFATCPEMLAGVHFKWESMRSTSVTPTFGLVFLDLRVVAPLLILLISVVIELLSRRLSNGNEDVKAKTN